MFQKLREQIDSGLLQRSDKWLMDLTMSLNVSKTERDIFSLFVFTTLWCIQLHGNHCVFHFKKSPLLVKVIKKVQDVIKDYILTLSNCKLLMNSTPLMIVLFSYENDRLAEDTKSKWTPPKTNVIKANCDQSFDSNLGAKSTIIITTNSSSLLLTATLIQVQ